VTLLQFNAWLLNAYRNGMAKAVAAPRLHEVAA
jgi:hypothetical protein